MLETVKKENIVSQVEELVKIVMPADPCHGLEHVLRVRKLALELADHVNEPVDREVLELAALLHDIGRVISEEKHALLSAKIAKAILILHGYDLQKAEAVFEAIVAHSFSMRHQATKIEAKILSDADKIDALGAIGIARVFAYSGLYGRSFSKSVEHFYEKILKLKDLMYTEYGKELALKRTKIIEQYLDELCKEYEEACLNPSDRR